MKKINQTRNGVVYKSNRVDKYSIEFNNLNFVFNRKEFENFAKYFNDLNGEYYARLNKHSMYKRELIVPIGQENINMLLNLAELSELRTLLNIDLEKKKNLEIPRFDYDFGKN